MKAIKLNRGFSTHNFNYFRLSENWRISEISEFAILLIRLGCYIIKIKYIKYIDQKAQKHSQIHISTNSANLIKKYNSNRIDKAKVSHKYFLNSLLLSIFWLQKEIQLNIPRDLYQTQFAIANSKWTNFIELVVLYQLNYGPFKKLMSTLLNWFCDECWMY